MYVPKKHYSFFLLNVSVNTFHAGEQHKGERLCSECQKHESNNQLKAQHVFRCDATSKEAAVMVEALPILRVISQLFWTGFTVSSRLRYLSICSVHFELRALQNKLFNKPPKCQINRLQGLSPNLIHTAGKLCNDAIQMVATRSSVYLGQSWPHLKSFEHHNSVPHEANACFDSLPSCKPSDSTIDHPDHRCWRPPPLLCAPKQDLLPCQALDRRSLHFCRSLP